MTPTPETLACYLHAGQVDKAGATYLLHLSRVARALPPTASADQHAAAWLHDALEQGVIAGGLPCTVEWLAQWITSGALALVVELTRPPTETYREYIARLSPAAAVVKLADVRDNLRPPVPGGLERRYRWALVVLQQTLERAAVETSE